MITTLLFAVMGVSFLLSQRTTIGGVLLLLAVFRAAGAVRQLQYAFGSDEDDQSG